MAAWEIIFIDFCIHWNLKTAHCWGSAKFSLWYTKWIGNQTVIPFPKSWTQKSKPKSLPVLRGQILPINDFEILSCWHIQKWVSRFYYKLFLEYFEKCTLFQIQIHGTTVEWAKIQWNRKKKLITAFKFDLLAPRIGKQFCLKFFQIRH